MRVVGAVLTSGFEGRKLAIGFVRGQACGRKCWAQVCAGPSTSGTLGLEICCAYSCASDLSLLGGVLSWSVLLDCSCKKTGGEWCSSLGSWFGGRISLALAVHMDVPP